MADYQRAAEISRTCPKMGAVRAMLKLSGFPSLKSLAVTAAIVLLTNGLTFYKSYNAGKANVYAELAVNAIKIEKARKKDDANTQDLSDYAICVRDLRSRGMPDKTCNGLRRVRP